MKTLQQKYAAADERQRRILEKAEKAEPIITAKDFAEAIKAHCEAYSKKHKARLTVHQFQQECNAGTCAKRIIATGSYSVAQMQVLNLLAGMGYRLVKVGTIKRSKKQNRRK